jgi:hypothetical protein
MNTTEKGNISEGKIMAYLLSQGKNVLIPLRDNLGYDLLIDENGKFTRIQCKTGNLTRGAIIFSTHSQPLINGTYKKVSYKGRADLFMVYSPELDKIYRIAVNDVGNTYASLRVEPTKNNQNKLIRWAKNYEV